MLKKGLFKTLGVAAMATMLCSMPVLANRTWFAFDLYDAGESAYSSWNIKNDEEQQAYVHCEGGDIVNSDEFYMGVYGNDGYNYTVYDRRISSSTALYYLDYPYQNAHANYELRLRALTYKNPVYVEGFWFS